jgi:uncharacterized membrane protein YdbT with pleckstrin-like domain|tara:strand:+ start:57 stop:353 length:297 start_codon:yes stop_codon:yes gene_type:complete
VLIAFGDGLLRLITVVSSEFGVTSKRVMVKTGFISRTSLETLLTKVEGIGVDQSVLGRVLGYGSIVVSGTGGSKRPFKMIRHPLEFRRQVQEQITSTE